MKYGEGAAQSATQRGAKSASRAAGSASRQAGTAHRRFAVFDIDGTLIRWQLYHAIADNLVKLGFIAPMKFQAIKDARMVWKRRESSESYKQYEAELIKLYEDVLSEISVKQFEEAARAVFEEYKDQIYTYTRDSIKDLKAKGYLLFAISGSQVEVVSLIADYYGFDDCVGTEYLKQNGRFSGKVRYYAADKSAVLKGLVKKHGATMEGSTAIGDSRSDIAMMKLVKSPIAFNPDQALFKTAKTQGWKVVIERKNMVYKLESKDGKYQLVKTS